MTTLHNNAIDDFREKFRGTILLPNNHGYDSARKIWNGMFDRKPAIIARCIGAM